MYQCKIFPVSEDSILLSWPEKICPLQHEEIHTIKHTITSRLGKYIIESIASYNTLLIYYAIEKIPYQQFYTQLKHVLTLPAEVSEHQALNQNNIVEIPVYYGEEVAWDLAEVATRCQLSTADVVSLHSHETYRAYALGFTPGFCYLGALAKQLILSRKSTPRLTVPKGAVAIAESQTAIYPTSSPGGWHIIGQTPVSLYQASAEQFTPLISVGQRVKFIPITKTEFESLSNNAHQPRSLNEVKK